MATGSSRLVFRAVKANPSKIVGALPAQASVLITRDGRPGVVRPIDAASAALRNTEP